MNTADFTSVINEAIQSLSAEGKTPNLALVKSRLATPVPMPFIIAALQSWKQKGVVPKLEQCSPLSTDEKIAQLEAKVRALELKIQTLEKNGH